MTRSLEDLTIFVNGSDVSLADGRFDVLAGKTAPDQGGLRIALGGGKHRLIRVIPHARCLVS
ncbi:MAG: hypothetical protein MZU97_10015 [Bacillus subtilis]|nr:hypothetical protein [Bacillus subtilis]